MPKSVWPTILCALFASAPLCAQGQVWIIDASNGPGTNFRNLPQAVLAARSGDLLLVRPGSYSGFSTQKGLTILGGSGRYIAAPYRLATTAVTLSGLPVNETFTLLGMELLPAGFMLQQIEIVSCAGRVHLEEVRNRNLGGSTPLALPSLRIQDSASVVITRSLFSGNPGVLALRSTLIATDSECSGGLGFGQSFAAGYGIHAEGSRITLSRCRVRGGDFWNAPPTNPANIGFGLSSVLSDWMILGDETTQVEAGYAAGYPIQAMNGTGTMQKNPIVSFVPTNGATPISASISTTDLAIPSLRTSGAPLGGTLAIDLFGSAGDAFALFVGVPGTPAQVGTLGELWIDHGVGLIFTAGGTIAAHRHFAMSAAVPNEPLLLGARFAWQAASGNATNGFLISNPSIHSLP